MNLQGCKYKHLIWGLLIIVFLTACQSKSWNNPYPSQDDQANFYYSSFTEQPKTLDPAKAYSTNETLFTGQIYEPPLQYHYLKRPYTLMPLTLTAMPQITYLDKNNQVLPANTLGTDKNIAYTVYTLQIKPKIYFQPHPAFANQNFTEQDLADKNTLADFPKVGTRELTADDYIYEIKRLADPRVQSPIYDLLSQHIVGFSEFNSQVRQQEKNKNLDLRAIPIQGVRAIDRYTYQIKIKGNYPQFIYWLAMPFFSPMPWEADKFYSQAGMKDNNITLSWYPIGTGPYMLAENNPNRQMVLVRNPNFHGENYPVESAPANLAGKPLPFIDKFIFSLEKESVPRWNKFLQGYYDQSGISSDSFDQAIHVDSAGNPDLTPLLKKQGIKLQTSIAPSIYYIGFNMLDPVVGGDSEQARKLRRAIAIALNYEEYIAIFLNGRGIPAQGPLPAGIFGYQPGQTGINPYIYQWLNNQPVRRPLEEAKKLLAAAGYPNGYNSKTHQQLLLNLDLPSGGSGDDSSYFQWLRKQFLQLGIELQIRDTQYNRFQEKVRRGQTQLFAWAWIADYPDPENFFFLLYGPNGKVKHGGENAANYQNKLFDQLFEQMRDTADGPERQKIINQMLAIVRQDGPWIWGFNPQNFLLTQAWVGFTNPNDMANNTLKYLSIDPKQRAVLRMQWNHPIFWPLGIILLLIMISLIPVIISYWRKQYAIPSRVNK